MEGVQWVVKSDAARVRHGGWWPPFWRGEAPERSKTRAEENRQLDAENVTLGQEARRAVPGVLRQSIKDRRLGSVSA